MEAFDGALAEGVAVAATIQLCVRTFFFTNVFSCPNVKVVKR